MAETTEFNRYMIESPHEPDECDRILRDVLAMGYLHHFDWGCKDGVHMGWAIVETEDKVQALMLVPPVVRQRARVTRLVHWFDEDFED